MRSMAAALGLLVVTAAGMLVWQRGQISSLRAEVGAERAALANERDRLDALASQLDPAPAPEPTRMSAVQAALVRSPDPVSLRADERRVILAQYRDVLAQANLPEATAARLQDLLADRVEAFLDAQDAARREGFAEGSAEMQRAIAGAIAEDDRQIGALMNLVENIRQAATPAPAPMEPWGPPATPAVVVTVVNQAPAETAPGYGEPAPGPDLTLPVAPSYSYFPVGYIFGGGLSRPFVGARPGLARPHRSPVSPRTHRG
jgi:hypothetical protein